MERAAETGEASKEEKGTEPIDFPVVLVGRGLSRVESGTLPSLMRKECVSTLHAASGITLV